MQKRATQAHLREIMSKVIICLTAQQGLIHRWQCPVGQRTLPGVWETWPWSSPCWKQIS